MSVWISACLWCMVDTVKPWRKRMQHLYATVLDHFAPRWAGLTKRTQHCATWRPNARNNVARCCTNILHPFGQAPAKRGHIVAATLCPAMLPARGKTRQHCCAPRGHHKCFRRFSEMFFVSDTNVAHVAKHDGVSNVATTMCPRFASPGQTDATCSLGATSCNIVACDMLHNVAFVWPTLLDKLQHDPTMLHATCMLHLFGLGFILVCVIWKIIWIWHLVYCLFTNLVYYPHSWVWLSYQPCLASTLSFSFYQQTAVDSWRLGNISLEKNSRITWFRT